MSREEAKEILLLFRPETAGPADPEFTEALACARNDPELAAWFDRHCAIQKAFFAGFERIPVPPGLKEQILAEKKAHETLRPRRKAMLLAAGAALVTGLLLLFILSSESSQDRQFSSFRMRMAGKVARDYPRMDLETNDLTAIRGYLAGHDGPGDYVLSKALEKTQGTGCALFDWRGNRVSMLCFNSGKNSDPKTPDLFLFIVNRASVRKPPGAISPELMKIKQLATASWSRGDKTYLLAGVGDENFLRQYY